MAAVAVVERRGEDRDLRHKTGEGREFVVRHGMAPERDTVDRLLDAAELRVREDLDDDAACVSALMRLASSSANQCWMSPSEPTWA